MPRAKGVVFPYGIRLREAGAVDIFPAAEVFFRTQEGEWLALFLIIDSGATISALPRSDAFALGLHYKDGVPIDISGVSGEVITTWQHEVIGRIGGYTLKIPVVFLDDDSAPRVLGRARIFEHFTVVFEEVRRRSAFIGTPSTVARRMTKILDDLSLNA